MQCLIVGRANNRLKSCAAIIRCAKLANRSSSLTPLVNTQQVSKWIYNSDLFVFIPWICLFRCCNRILSLLSVYGGMGGALKCRLCLWIGMITLIKTEQAQPNKSKKRITKRFSCCIFFICLDIPSKSKLIFFYFLFCSW